MKSLKILVEIQKLNSELRNEVEALRSEVKALRKPSYTEWFHAILKDFVGITG